MFLNFYFDYPSSVFIEAEDKFDDATAGTMLDGAEMIVEKIVELMHEPKHGNPYKHKDGTVRNASAEGEAPGIDSEDLVGGFDVIEVTILEAQVNNDVEHGRILQDYFNRPFVGPASDAVEGKIIALVQKTAEEKWR